MEIMGFTEEKQLEDYLKRQHTLNSPTKSSQKHAAEEDIYDCNGFYLEENDDLSLFPFDDDGNKNTIAPTIDIGVHPSALQWGEPASASRPSPFAPRPLSEPLKRLFRRVHINPATRRTEKKITLSDNQLAEAREHWEKQAVEHFCSLKEETPCEKKHLDTWDFSNMQYQWQTEGLFLCRLMEIKEQVTFIEAKRAFRAGMHKQHPRPKCTHPKGTKLGVQCATKYVRL
ncbi:hypothetical protein RRF57_002308 [Xylaria bambusicola]|uniref:Uncharacterized protein n=1 Tax=Xylaria bambusicola TaxID=326684 RepID=A0AAN7UDE2_9PEZI